MVILPIVHKNHILNVEIRLKNVEKVRSGVKYDDALESDIIINSNKFSESSFNIPNDISYLLKGLIEFSIPSIKLSLSNMNKKSIILTKLINISQYILYSKS